MPIEFICQSCNNQLRVPDEHAGKQAKCPSCKSVNSIPALTTSTPQAPTTAATGNEEESSSVSTGSLTNNPYSPTAVKRGGIPATGNSAVFPFKPLYECLFFLKFIAWYCIIFGALYCLTIVGIIAAWAIIWLGLCLKNAARDIEIGYPRGDANLLHNAAVQLGTATKIAGVFCMIGVAILALYFMVFVFALIIGISSAAAQ